MVSSLLMPISRVCPANLLVSGKLSNIQLFNGRSTRVSKSDLIRLPPNSKLSPPSIFCCNIFRVDGKNFRVTRYFSRAHSESYFKNLSPIASTKSGRSRSNTTMLSPKRLSSSARLMRVVKCQFTSVRKWFSTCSQEKSLAFPAFT